MHVVLINQYYPPDEAPTGLMLEAVAGALVEAGHRVTVLCAEGGYARARDWQESSADRDAEPQRNATASLKVERVAATKWGRGTMAGKLVDYLTFYCRVAWKLAILRPRPDRIVALTTPPYLSILARLLSKVRRADHAHWVMDLYPDVMVAHGMLHERGASHSALSALTRLGFGGRRCAAVVTLGPDMLGRLAPYLQPGRTGAWVALWAADEPGTARVVGAGEIESASCNLRTKRGWRDDDLVLMYSGNMGLGHRFGEFLSIADALAAGDRRVRLAFFGNGKRRPQIEAFLREYPDAAVELHDYVPRHLLSAHLRSADVHLASLEPAWDGAMLPSKLQGIFAAGRPVIFVGSRSSSIGRWIAESGGGWVVAPGDREGLLEAIKEAGDDSTRELRGTAARDFHDRHFDRTINARRTAELLACGGR